MSVIAELRRQKQEDFPEFETSVVYIAGSQVSLGLHRKKPFSEKVKIETQGNVNPYT